MSNYPSESCITLCFHNTAWALIFQSLILNLEETFGIFQLSHWTLANCMVKIIFHYCFGLNFFLLPISLNISSCFLLIFLFFFFSVICICFYCMFTSWLSSIGFFIFFFYFDFLTVHKLGKWAFCQLSSKYFSILVFIIPCLFTGILRCSVNFPFLASGQR